jgi:hypothetical protein
VRPRAVGAVRLGREGGRLALAGAALQELAEGVVDLTLGTSGLRDVAGFRRAARAALERAGALSGGALTLVLPDPLVRLSLLPAEGLRGRRAEMEETIRFRLHRTLPFDARAARVAWEGPYGDRLLVAVAFAPAVAAYEEALGGLGFDVGLVEAASLALLSVCEREPASGDRLLVNWDDGYVSFVVTRAGRPLLVRTLPGESGEAEVAAHAEGTVRYLRDRLGGNGLSAAVVRAAGLPTTHAAEALRPALGVAPSPFRPWATLGLPEPEAAGQALAGAAAGALRSAR